MIEFWYQALASECGIVLTTDNPARLIQYLYRARTDAQDPDLQVISVCQSPVNPSHLWLVKRGRSATPSPTEES